MGLLAQNLFLIRILQLYNGIPQRITIFQTISFIELCLSLVFFQKKVTLNALRLNI